MALSEEKERDLRLRPHGDLESPFLEEGISLGESRDVWAPRFASLEAESPFQRAFEQDQELIVVSMMEESTFQSEEEPDFYEEPLIAHEEKQPRLQYITHAGQYRLAYDRIPGLGYGVIEPLPGREKRRFRGTATLQTALDKGASYIDRILPPPKYILTGGVYVDKSGLHSKGNAIDIDGIWWSESNKFLANQAPSDWGRYLTIEASLRKVFGTVLNYDYNRNHRDHWHCDLGTSPGWRKVRSITLFAQRALREIWGENLAVDGKWGRLSRGAATRNGYDFTVTGEWERFLDDIINLWSTTPVSKETWIRSEEEFEEEDIAEPEAFTLAEDEDYEETGVEDFESESESEAEEAELESFEWEAEETHDEFENDYEDDEQEDIGEEFDTFEEPFASSPLVQKVIFPSGLSLPVITGLPEGKKEDYWDPWNSGNPLLDTGPAYKEKKLSPNFTVRELTTSGGVSADVARIDPKLVEHLQRLREHIGQAVTITSGYRSWKRNVKVYDRRKKKPTRSQHCSGRAADIKIKGMNGLQIGKAAIDACGPNIGIGLGKTFAHIDMRGEAVAWNYGGVDDSWVEEIKRYQRVKRESHIPSDRSVADLPVELVEFAQRILNVAEGESLFVDGDLGPKTRGALERFRRKYNLGAGSALDDATQLALAQRALEEIRQQSIFGQYGLMDTATRDALVTFKSERGLGTDSTLDATTRVALSDVLARRATAVSGSMPIVTSNGLPKLGTGLIPPTNMTSYRKFRLTTYHLADQRKLPTGAVRVPVYDDSGHKLADVSPAFFAKLSLEGSGILTDGRLINVTGKKVSVSHDDYAEVLAFHRHAYAKRDEKRQKEGRRPTSTTYSGIVVKNNRVVRALAFHEVTASRRGMGYGIQRGIPLVPFRTLAADIGHIKYIKVEPKWKGKGGLVPPGTHVYIKEYDGLRLPDGTLHDGWFIVNDTGGGIFGAHFDVFIGTQAKMKLPEFGQVWFPGIEQRIPLDYTYGLKP